MTDLDSTIDKLKVHVQRVNSVCIHVLYVLHIIQNSALKRNCENVKKESQPRNNETLIKAN